MNFGANRDIESRTRIALRGQLGAQYRTSEGRVSAALSSWEKEWKEGMTDQATGWTTSKTSLGL